MIVYGMLIITFGCMPPCALVICLYPIINRRRSLATVNNTHRPYRYTPLNTQVSYLNKQASPNYIPLMLCTYLVPTNLMNP